MNECCPVCSGRGFVPAGFYSSTESTWATSDLTTEACRTCDGRGAYDPDPGAIVARLVRERDARDADGRRVLVADESLHENCTLAEGHPTLRLVDELRERIAELEEEHDDWRRRAEAAEYALAPYLDENGWVK